MSADFPNGEEAISVRWDSPELVTAERNSFMSESPKARPDRYLNELEKSSETKALLYPTLDQRIWVTSTLQKADREAIYPL